MRALVVFSARLMYRKRSVWRSGSLYFRASLQHSLARRLWIAFMRYWHSRVFSRPERPMVQVSQCSMRSVMPWGFLSETGPLSQPLSYYTSLAAVQASTRGRLQ
jgi:hypothetical protein